GRTSPAAVTRSGLSIKQVRRSARRSSWLPICARVGFAFDPEAMSGCSAEQRRSGDLVRALAVELGPLSLEGVGDDWWICSRHARLHFGARMDFKRHGQAGCSLAITGDSSAVGALVVARRAALPVERPLTPQLRP